LGITKSKVMGSLTRRTGFRYPRDLLQFLQSNWPSSHDGSRSLAASSTPHRVPRTTVVAFHTPLDNFGTIVVL